MWSGTEVTEICKSERRCLQKERFATWQPAANREYHCSRKNDPTAVIWNLARLWWFKYTYMDTKSLKNVLKCRSFVIALFFVCLHYPPQRWFYFYLTWTSSIFLSLHPDLRQALGEASNSTICVKNSSEESNILWFLHFLLVFFLFIVISQWRIGIDYSQLTI